MTLPSFLHNVLALALPMFIVVLIIAGGARRRRP